MSAYHIGQLVDKMSNPDKDFRFMACNDLMKDLQFGTISLEDDSTAKVMRALIRLLSDSNGEVQNLAIKCIGLLAQPAKVKTHHIEYLIEELTPHIFSKAEQSRDIHSLTLKAMLSNLAPSGANTATITIVKRMLPKFMDSLPLCPPDDAARIDVLDLIGEVLLKFGDSVPDMHKAALRVMIDHLASSRSAIRKKAIVGIGHLAPVVNPQLYTELVEELLADLANRTPPKSTAENARTRTLVIALSTVARASGSKFSAHTPKVMPHLLKILEIEGDADSENDDLKEAALQGLEVFLYRSPQEVAAFEKPVIEQLTNALAYDPNYEYGDDGEEDEKMEEDDEDAILEEICNGRIGSSDVVAVFLLVSVLTGAKSHFQALKWVVVRLLKTDLGKRFLTWMNQKVSGSDEGKEKTKKNGRNEVHEGKETCQDEKKAPREAASVGEESEKEEKKIGRGGGSSGCQDEVVKACVDYIVTRRDETNRGNNII